MLPPAPARKRSGANRRMLFMKPIVKKESALIAKPIDKRNLLLKVFAKKPDNNGSREYDTMKQASKAPDIKLDKSNSAAIFGITIGGRS